MRDPAHDREMLRGVLRAMLTTSDSYRDQTLTRAEIVAAAASATLVAPGTEVTPEELVTWAEMHFNVRQEEAAILRGDDVDHKPWLKSKRSDALPVDGFWDHYRRLLDDRIPPGPLNVLDDVTDKILDSLEDPARPGQWDRRGLVMGHVQSGKTANYVGLAAKAMDAGYKLVIILAGVHNNLRAQTQSRVDEGIIGRDTRRGPNSVGPVGVGLMTNSRVPMTMTSAVDSGDFKKAVASSVGNPFSQIDVPTVFVIKKHVSILENLHDWLAENANRPAGHDRIAGTPLLLIDDEADNASIDTARDSNDDDETDPTRTNAGIRRILNLFDQSAYVGYTATPFANVFIDDKATHSKVGDDLFPRDFIFALEAPSNYVGPRRVFGISTRNEAGEAEDLGLPMVTRVFDHLDWLPPTHKSDFTPEADDLPESLKNAIRAFVLTCAARHHRGHRAAHNSMLIHVTRFVHPQNVIHQLVQDVVIELRNALTYDASSPEWDRLKAIWERDFLAVGRALQDEDHPPPLHTFDEVRPHVAQAVGAITVRALNGSSTDVLDYEEHREHGLAVIAIGGAKLSRGLTLEGLSISYYLRDTRMYDTLMQMGRWFGYRPGYLDLCRVYTSDDVIGWYRSIATATEELLEDFRSMQEANSRPKDFGLRVRLSPGMMITSQARMKSGTRRKVNFGNQRPEVTSFEIDPLRRSIAVEAMDAFISGLGEAEGGQTNVPTDRLWRNVDGSKVLEYFVGLDRGGLYPNSVSARPRYLADYLARRMRDGGLVTWTVFLKSKRSSERRHTLDQSGITVGLSRRSDRSGASRYSIKSLIGSSDEGVDLSAEVRDELARAGKNVSGSAFRSRRDPANGLLILYLLDGDEVETRGEDDVLRRAEHIPNGPPFAAFCVSFPIDPDPENNAIEYIVNTVFDDGMRDVYG